MSDTPAVAHPQEADLLARLRAGDESAFESLIEMYHAQMVRLASVYTPNTRVAEEVTQETWIALLKGLDGFEGRSSLKTWLFSILVNRARTVGQREGRYVAAGTLEEPEPGEPLVSPGLMRPADDPQHSTYWSSYPAAWDTLPESRLQSLETRRVVQDAIDALPHNQREAITLRDIDGLSSEEVCNILGISQTNQRVLLHRARARVRRALASYLVEE